MLPFSTKIHIGMTSCWRTLPLQNCISLKHFLSKRRTVSPEVALVVCSHSSTFPTICHCQEWCCTIFSLPLLWQFFASAYYFHAIAMISILFMLYVLPSLWALDRYTVQIIFTNYILKMKVQYTTAHRLRLLRNVQIRLLEIFSIWM